VGKETTECEREKGDGWEVEGGTGIPAGREKKGGKIKKDKREIKKTGERQKRTWSFKKSKRVPPT